MVYAMRDDIDRKRSQRRPAAFKAGMLLAGIYLSLLLSSPLLFPSLFSPSLGMESTPIQDNLILNVYLDPAGKALLTGYADNISGLESLAGSEYQYENDTGRLYALTDGLTAKSGQIWTLNFGAIGTFEDCRITFYLPGDIRLGSINSSTGLQYHLSAFNGSLVADVQGYEVQNPWISIQYQQPLANGSAPIPSSALPPRPSPGDSSIDLDLILFLAGAFILAMGSALGMILWRRRFPLPISSSSPERDVQPKADRTISSSPLMSHFGAGDDGAGDEEAGDGRDGDERARLPVSPDSSNPDPSNPAASGEEGTGALLSPLAHVPADADDRHLPTTASLSSSADSPADGSSSSHSDSGPDQAAAGSANRAEAQGMGLKKIELSREMEAVIQTLTPREKAVITTLVEHGGRMTQAEIRYETRTPKSSLTGILISLERRRLVTKKEWGRTNMIELSEWFLSQRERS
ncbi:helix-turn-helix transcriptional regulator [Methanothrix sp.]|uniref:helix-turn-helix transcriptional regulator n=1 Tax=Methanothrix sp. TaxID=90426 RepID=UPI003C78FDE7